MFLWKHTSFRCIYLYILCVSAKFCEEQWQVQVDDDPKKVTINKENNHVSAIDLIFDNSSFKKSGNKYILCPCDYVYCMHRCSSKFSFLTKNALLYIIWLKNYNVFISVKRFGEWEQSFAWCYQRSSSSNTPLCTPLRWQKL